MQHLYSYNWYSNSKYFNHLKLKSDSSGYYWCAFGFHCCLNVTIYGIFDPKFRQIFIELFSSSSKRNKADMNTMKMNEIRKPFVSDSHVTSTLPHKLSMKPSLIGIPSDICQKLKNITLTIHQYDLTSKYLP